MYVTCVLRSWLNDGWHLQEKLDAQAGDPY